MVSTLVETKTIQHQVKHEITINGYPRDAAQVWIPIFNETDEVSQILEVVMEINCNISNQA